ncbi:60Kd inner membrane protein-domain-containing protein [Mycena rebaudengoi]|nr:60Kd inner membrane protein-domain-containing protein [Mycena rebaudengoi]
MFAVRSGPRRLARRVFYPRPLSHRLFTQSLCDGFLDLAIALPFPPSVPPYSATIILITIASRLVLFPVALWGRNRVRRLEDVVLPELERLKPIISKEVLDDMKRTGVRREQLVPAKLQQMHLARMVEKVKSERKRLIAEHKCHPLPSILVSPATQLPVFVLMSMMFNRLARDPTPFDSEAFLTLTSLSQPDPTWTLPIILGMVTMANVESSNWLMTAVQRDRMRRLQEQQAQKLAAAGKPDIQPKNIIKSALNGLSVVRILLAAVSPGSVVLYWTTSATFGLLQTWVLDYRPAEKSTGSPLPIISPKSAVPTPTSDTKKTSKTNIVQTKKQKPKRHSW